MDCDDEEPSTHPGARDWWNDGVDANCDGADNTTLELADAPITIVGTSGANDRVGHELEVCDLNGDGHDDLIVSAPGYGDLNGAIAVFSGKESATWSKGMSLSSTPMLIEAVSVSHFFGFGTRCADLDGDGDLDIVTQRGECHHVGSSSYWSTFGVLGFYGDWDPSLEGSLADTDADFELSHSLGVTSADAEFYDRQMTVGDVDGLAGSEILVNMSVTSEPELYYVESSVWVIPGGTRYSGTGALQTVADPVIEFDADRDVALQVEVAEISDGKDSYSVVCLLQANTADERDAEGMVLAGLGSGTITAGDYADTSWVGYQSVYLGYWALFADLDGDGATDAALTVPTESSVATNAGGFYAFEDVAENWVGETAISEASADRFIYGSTTEGWLGYRMIASAGDANSDGTPDLLVGECMWGEYCTSATTRGWVYLLSGDPGLGSWSVEDSALMVWDAEFAADHTGRAMRTGDVDADGVPDLVFSAPEYGGREPCSKYPGKVYVYLSSDAW